MVIDEMLQGVFRKLGFELRDEIVFRCRCDAIVRVRGTLCASCAEAEVQELREMALGPARRSLPQWPHADLRNEHLPKIVDRRIMHAIRTWSVADGRNLVLLGDTGKGKTTGAVALVKNRLDRAKTAEQVRIASGIRMFTAQDLHDARSQHPFGARGDAKLVRIAKTCELLVLDEVGFESGPTKHGVEIVFEIMQARYGGPGHPFRPTIVTSGRAETRAVIASGGRRVPSLADRYGEATKRRMTERALVVECFDAYADARGAA